MISPQRAPQQVIDLFEANDLVGIGLEADAIRKKLHPESIVTYCIDSEADSSSSQSARISFAPDETLAQHIERLETLREMQALNGGYALLIPSFEGTAAEYLKLLALSRIYVDNIPHLQASWSAGLKLCQIALRFGANDIGGPNGLPHRPSEEQLRCLIRDAGFVPKQRDAAFRTYFLP